jgi:hypothetical protein
MLGCRTGTKGFSPPLGLNEVHLPVEFDDAIDLFYNTLNFVSDKREGFPDQNSVHCKKPVEDRFEQLATPVRIGFGEQSQQVMPDVVTLLASPLHSLRLSLPLFNTAPPLDVSLLPHSGERVSDVHHPSNVSYESLGHKLIPGQQVENSSNSTTRLMTSRRGPR